MQAKPQQEFYAHCQRKSCRILSKVMDMPKSAPNKVYIIGHKSPDCDSIVSAIAYAEIKNALAGWESAHACASQDAPASLITYYPQGPVNQKQLPAFIMDLRPHSLCPIHPQVQM